MYIYTEFFNQLSLPFCFPMDKISTCECFFKSQIDKTECFKRKYRSWLKHRNIFINEYELKSIFNIDAVLKLSFKNCITEAEKFSEMIILWSFLEEFKKKHSFLGQVVYDLPYSDKINEFPML